MEEGESEIIIFASSGLKEIAIKEFDPSKVKINKASTGLGMPLRLTSDGNQKNFLETGLGIWKANKGNMRVTFRIAGGKTLELKDSNVSEIENLLSQMH